MLHLGSRIWNPANHLNSKLQRNVLCHMSQGWAVCAKFSCSSFERQSSCSWAHDSPQADTQQPSNNSKTGCPKNTQNTFIKNKSCFERQITKVNRQSMKCCSCQRSRWGWGQLRLLLCQVALASRLDPKQDDSIRFETCSKGCRKSAGAKENRAGNLVKFAHFSSSRFWTLRSRFLDSTNRAEKNTPIEICVPKVRFGIRVALSREIHNARRGSLGQCSEILMNA